MTLRKLCRFPKAKEITGRGTSSFYSDIKDGLMVPGVRIGANAVAWPEDELAALNAARIAGQSDDEIRALVKRLVAARKASADQVSA